MVGSGDLGSERTHFFTVEIWRPSLRWVKKAVAMKEVGGESLL